MYLTFVLQSLVDFVGDFGEVALLDFFNIIYINHGVNAHRTFKKVKVVQITSPGCNWRSNALLEAVGRLAKGLVRLGGVFGQVDFQPLCGGVETFDLTANIYLLSNHT